MLQEDWFELGDKGEKATVAEPLAVLWRDLATYDSALQHGIIDPLERAVQQQGHAPIRLQLAVLQHLHWYFTVDARARAPTVALTEANSTAFHDRMRRIMQQIDPETLEALDAQQVSTEVRHALLSYQDPQRCSMVAVDSYDHDQGLVRLSYYVHGEPPTESFLIDGEKLEPIYAKYRACRYFHRTLLRQRIVWLPASGAASLEVNLAGVPVPIALGQQPFLSEDAEQMHPRLAADEVLPAVRLAYPPGKGGQQPLPPGWAGWKVRLLKALARMPLVRWKYSRAWVLVDRDVDADDNAEHLYRWITAHHPEINAWYLLRPESADWDRLKAEGFRLMPPGLLRRLMVLNSEHIISSHTDHVFGGFDRALYGDAMPWRATFLQHGVIKDDLSHWLGPREFDRFITSSPDEHRSVVGDGTAYPFTGKEVRRTGLPRHDKLLEIGAQVSTGNANVLLVMPTWRGSLVDARQAAYQCRDHAKAIAESEYAQRWRALLRSDELREMAACSGKQIVFMPHPNALPYIAAFDPPKHVMVATKETAVMQKIFAQSTALITDYTSVAFDMAVLRRTVFYYQFDRDAFYRGGHNWRPGYFDYERDGFGPVVLNEDDLLLQLRHFFDKGCQAKPEYLARMEHAMPNNSDSACQRVFESILEMCRPVSVAKPSRQSMAGVSH